MPSRLHMLVCSGLRSDVGQCPMNVYMFSGFQSDVGQCPRNVCMLDVFLILACFCICMFPDFSSIHRTSEEQKKERKPQKDATIEKEKLRVVSHDLLSDHYMPTDEEFYKL